ncbi:MULTISPECIES: cyclophilin-like fold protein [unclassified Pseudomonas]|uniref:cyclophilin-like fold protein n=1 Tax=unclassified Pseudomonas TaxID=196821 RepID=UPI00215C0203|nr:MULTISPECIES: cyclophilin-like fold protein [unclassified Pseudomonas]MCR8930892.1 cyclophilin-like fold protein [Pseudomonas sp. S11A4]MCR8974499.1 cyclophilin-like fold protein [Pseudomonas sp. S11P7]
MIERRARIIGWRNLAAMLACAALTLSLMAQGAALDPPAVQPVASTKESSMPGHAHVLPRLKLGFAGGGRGGIERQHGYARPHVDVAADVAVQRSQPGREDRLPPRKLKTTAAPFGLKPAVGDFALYAPWGNLVAYYREFESSSELVHLGRFVSGLEQLAAMEGEFSVTLQAVD